jgi:hypothetical protein
MYSKTSKKAPTRHRNITWLVFVLAILQVVTGCGNRALQLLGGSGTKVVGLASSADGASFSSRCGAKASELSDPAYTVVDQVMKSTFIVSGTKAEITYEATFEATVKVKASSLASSQVTLVKVVNLRSDDDGRFSKTQVDDAAASQSNTKTTKGMGSGRLLKLQRSDPRFLGIECSVGFVASSKIENSEGTGLVAFEPGLVSSVNPKASMDTYIKELGSKRTFVSVATIQEQAKGYAAVGAQATITTTITKVPADAKRTAGVPSDAPVVKADVAFEVTSVASGIDLSTFGVSKRQVYFINTSTHQLVAVLDDSGRVNPSSKKPLDPVLAVLQ